MHSIDNKLIKGKVPFLRGRTVLYVGTPTGTWVDSAPEWVADRLRRAGYSFLYLPELLGQLSPVVLQYLIPGLDGTPSDVDLYYHIGDIAGLEGRPGFLYKSGRKSFFRTLPDGPEGLDGFLDNLPRPRRVNKTEGASEELFNFNETNYSFIEEESSADAEIIPESEVEEPLDKRTQAILDAWHKLADKYGITLKDLELLLGTQIKLSRLSISRNGSIRLIDWPDSPEIKLDKLSKALYFFYLKHPEGIPFKDLQDYEDEIYDLYERLSGRDDPEGIRRSIEGLVAPFSDSRNPCVSRIKRAFKNIVEDRIAQYYYIDGRYAEKRFVRIDRDMVIWEH